MITFNQFLKIRILTLVLIGGGGRFYPLFTDKTIQFQGYLRVRSRGHQVRGFHCKLIKYKGKKHPIKSMVRKVSVVKNKVP